MRALHGRVFFIMFFPFITLNILCHSLLACRVSAEKSADSLMAIPLYIICCFSLVTFNIFFFVFNSFQFDSYVSQYVPPWIYILWDSLCFLHLGDYYLPHFREVSNYYLLKYFLMVLLFVFFFRDSYDSNVGAFYIVP